jgi:hypothetical protein
MSFSDGAQKKLIILIEVEKGHRIDTDTWIQDATYTNCWWISHTNVVANIEREGKPSRVEENGEEYTERATLELCNTNAGSWFWDSANKRLYIHTSGSNNPGGGSYIILSYIWMRFAAQPYVFGGKLYLPRLKEDSISEISYSTAGYHEGGTQQTFSAVALINADGFFDEEFSDYIWEAKKLIGRVGEDGGAEGDFIVFMNQWTGDLEWTDEEVVLSVEDLRRCVI